MAKTKLVVNPTTGLLDVVQNIWDLGSGVISPVTNTDILELGDAGTYGWASGDVTISRSAANQITITASDKVVTTHDLDVQGDIYMPDDLVHTGDTDTKIEFRPDQIKFWAGGKDMLYIYENEALSEVTVNPASDDIMFKVLSDDGTVLLQTDPDNNRVGILNAAPAYALDVGGDIFTLESVYAGTTNTFVAGDAGASMASFLATGSAIIDAGDLWLTGNGSYTFYGKNGSSLAYWVVGYTSPGFKIDANTVDAGDISLIPQTKVIITGDCDISSSLGVDGDTLLKGNTWLNDTSGVRCILWDDTNENSRWFSATREHCTIFANPGSSYASMNLDGGSNATSITSGPPAMYWANTAAVNNSFAKVYFGDSFVGAACAIMGAKITSVANNYGEYHFWTRQSTGAATRLIIADNVQFPLADSAARGLNIGSANQVTIHRSAANQLTITASDKTIIDNTLWVGSAGSGEISCPGALADSEQFGKNAVANQIDSLAVGEDAQATGYRYTTAVGWQSRANGGEGASAFGANAQATSVGAFAMAYNAQASNTYAVAIGQSAVASQPYAFAMGFNAVASGNAAFALGYATDATGSYDLAIGAGSQATATYGVALGRTAQVTGAAGVAIGYLPTAVAYSIALGNAQCGHSYSIVMSGRGNSVSSATNELTLGDDTSSYAINTIRFGGTSYELNLARTAANELTITASTEIILCSPKTTVTGDLWVGNNADADPTIVFDGDTNDGQLAFDEDNAKFVFDSLVNNSAGLLTKVSTDDVSDPPTDAELDTAFGTPATLGAGFIGIVDDNSEDTDFYICCTSDTSWYYTKMTKAV